MIPVRHLTGDVNGLTVVHRDAPVIVLSHGRGPRSSSRRSSSRDTTAAWAATTVDPGTDPATRTSPTVSAADDQLISELDAAATVFTATAPALRDRA